MLGGLNYVHAIDVKNSLQTISSLKQKNSLKLNCAIDLGCGIGRVSMHVLSNYFAKIDLVEQNEKFLKEAEKVKSTVILKKWSEE